jgi:hypothetical protein
MLQFTEPKLKALGSSLKLLMVAEGDAHVCESPSQHHATPQTWSSPMAP